MRGPAYPERKGPLTARGLESWLADYPGATAAPDPALSSPCPGSVPGTELASEMGAPVPREAIRAATKQLGRTTLPTRSSRLACSFTPIQACARLTLPAPPLLRAPEPVGAVRRRKTKRTPRQLLGGETSEVASGTPPALGLGALTCAPLFNREDYLRHFDSRGARTGRGHGPYRPKTEEIAWPVSPNPPNCNAPSFLL